MSGNDENITKNAWELVNLGETMAPKTTDTSEKTTKKSSNSSAAAKKTADTPDETTSTAAKRTAGATKTAGASVKAANKTTSTTTKTTKAAGASKTTAAKNAAAKTSTAAKATTAAKSTKTTSAKPAKAAEPTKAAVAAKMPKASMVSAAKIGKSTTSTAAKTAKRVAGATTKPEKPTSGLATKTASKPAKKDETVIEKEVNVNGKPVSILLPSQAGNNPNDGMNINLTINLAGEEKKRRATTTTKRTPATTKTTSQATKTAPKVKTSAVKTQKTETQAKKVETPAKATEAQVSEVVLKKSKEKKKKKSPWWLLLILVLLLAVAVCVSVVVLPRGDAHTHTYSETWSTNESDHWHKCTGCDSVKDKASHAYDNACDTDCNVCGATRTTTHNYGTTYQSDDNNHWQDCSVCHTITAAEPHIFESGKCTVCDFVEVTQGLKYEFISGETVETPFYRVMGYKDGETPVKHVKIPTTYNDGTNGVRPVLEVIGHAFTNETTMVSVTFAGDIEVADGFYGCENLESVTFCGVVKKIGAFGNTPKLTSIAFPEGLKEIEETAFAFSGLTSVNIPASVEILGGNPFMGCENLTTITVDNENENYYVLNNYLIDRANKKIVTGLTFSNIPSNSEIVTTIGEYAFGVITETTLKIPNNITTIEGHAFYVSFLTSVELPNGLSEIREYLFSYCIALTKIVIPESVTTIYRSAFDNCTAMTTIYYGGDATDWAQIQHIGSYYNNSLDSATIYYYSENMPQELSVNAWRYVDGVPTAWPAHIAHSYVYKNNDTSHWQDCSVCHAITTSEVHAFVDGKCTCDYVEETQNLAYSFVAGATEEVSYYEVAGLGTATAKHIKIPATYNDGTNGEHPVKSVAKDAFQATSTTSAETTLLSITFLDNMETIEEYAFSGCISLTSVIFSSTITKIDTCAFAVCSTLTNITLPNGLKEIGTLAFSFTGLTSVNIPASVEAIGDNPFVFCENLNAITVNSESTNFQMINNCLIDIVNKQIIIGLDYSNIPTDSEKVTKIGNSAFANLTGVAHLKIPSNITSIGDAAFEFCGDIVSVEIPIELTEIIKYAFDSCEKLTTVYYVGTQSEWEAITIAVSGNSEIINATRYYYSENEPTTTGNYWHYVEGVPTAWETTSGGE